MRRREVLKTLAATLIGAGISPGGALGEIVRRRAKAGDGDSAQYDDHIKDYLSKMRHFNRPHPDDVYLDGESYRLLERSLGHLERLQRTVGHGNFHLLSFDDALGIARHFAASVGEFSKPECDFLERIFYEDASRYGFRGEKPLQNMTDKIQTGRVVKVPRTGNFLYRGHAEETYEKIRRELGDDVVLTSGVRSVMKQFLLFLNKAQKSKGNLSLASRSLAPPGFSYHGVGDFDVGQAGLGSDNFTTRFAATTVYRRLKDLGYLQLRYDDGNMLGVRFEPWHVKVEGRA